MSHFPREEKKMDDDDAQRREASERARRFWNEEFRKGSAPNEWLVPYAAFRDTFRRVCPPSPSILVIGCGTSSLSAELHDDDGSARITSTDISEVAVEAMRAKEAARRPRITWAVADIFGMPHIPTGAFDVVLDKATLDSVLFRQPASQRKSLGAVAVAEIGRVLRPGGVYFVVTPRKRFRAAVPELKRWSRVVNESVTADDLVVVRGTGTVSLERTTVHLMAFVNPVTI
jgi:SAM-dependent methyltransferase